MIQVEASATPEELRRQMQALTQRLRSPQYDSLRRAMVAWFRRVVLKRFVPGENIPAITELEEIDAMLADPMR